MTWLILGRHGPVHDSESRCGAVLAAVQRNQKRAKVTPLQARVYALPHCPTCFTVQAYEQARKVST